MSEINRKGNLFLGKMIALIAVVVISVVTWLICQFAVGSEKLGFPAVLTLFSALFLGAGLVSIAFGIVEKTTSGLFFGGTFFAIGLIFLLSALHVYWYVTLVIVIAILLIAFLSLFLLRGKAMQIQFDNKTADYKTYEQRQAEKSDAEKQEPKKELPELKSFKDEE